MPIEGRTPTSRQRRLYDPAGNVVRTITSRGYTITATYDTLNRLIRRQVPQVDYAHAGCTELGVPSGCGYRFPLYAISTGPICGSLLARTRSPLTSAAT